MVRHAVVGDVSRMLVLLRNFHTAGGFQFPFDAPRLDRFVRHAVDAADYAVLVLGDPIKGLLIARAADSLIAPLRFAEEQLVWIEPDARGNHWNALLTALEAWAREHRCDQVKLSSQQTIRSNAMARLYRRDGYEPVETVHAKAI